MNHHSTHAENSRASRSNEPHDFLQDSMPKFILCCLLLVCSALLPAYADPFVISTDGQEVTDTRTGLIWQRCPYGMRWQDNACKGAARYFMWYEALPAAQDEARATGKVWRVPNVKELSTIVDRRHINQAIDPTIFPDTPNDRFWSSSPYAADAFYGWVVDFFDGAVFYTYLEDMGALRLVRGEP